MFILLIKKRLFSLRIYIYKMKMSFGMVAKINLYTSSILLSPLKVNKNIFS